MNDIKEGRAPFKVARPSACLSHNQYRGNTQKWAVAQEPINSASIMELPVRPGANWAQCPSCRFVFTTPANFDTHRRSGRCLDPFSAGLVINSQGMWSRPQRAEIDCGVDVGDSISSLVGSDFKDQQAEDDAIIDRTFNQIVNCYTEDGEV